MTDLLFALLASYLAGSIPAGYVIGRIRGVDLRKVGSGNVGATNAGRILGWPMGLLAFSFDFLKGMVPALVFARMLVERGFVDIGPDAARLTCGAAAIVGHVFPVWLAFRGGKGVATSAGVCAAVHWPSLVVAVLVWGAVLKATRFMSLASIAGAVVFPLAFLVLVGPPVALHQRALVTSLAVLLAVAIMILHRQNIGRLRRGEELRIGGPRSGESER